MAAVTAFAATPAMLAAGARAAASSSLKLLTLVLVVQGDRVLLGRKKRGFGEGSTACRRTTTLARQRRFKNALPPTPNDGT